MSEAVAEPPVAEPPATDTPLAELAPEELEKRLKIQVVDVSHGVAANAIDAADEYIREQSSQGGIMGFAKRIWHGNLARDYIRQRQIQRGRAAIVESGNLYALEEASQAEHDQSMAAIVNRFTSDYDLLHQNETNQAFSDAERGQGFMNQIKQLVRAYAGGEMGIAALTEEKTRIVNEYAAGAHREDRNKGLLYADNIIEVAQNARLAVEHGMALDRIDEVLNGNIGEALVGVRTEARNEKVDQLVDRLYQSKAGSLVNETTLIGATSLAMNLAKVTVKKVTTAAGATIGLGVGAAVVAGAREHYHIGQERQLHMRQMAEGGQMAENSRRREKLEATRYETISAQELMDQLDEAMAGVNLVGETDPARLQDLLSSVSSVQSLVDLSDDRSIDLITFSSKTTVENERLDLDIKLAEAKVALQKILDTTPAEQLNAAGISTTNHHELITSRIETINDTVNQNITDKDRAFRKLRRNRTLGMAALGAATGITVGLGVQELKSLADDGLRGIFEVHSHEDRLSLLAAIAHHGSDGSATAEHGAHAASTLQLLDKGHFNHGGVYLPDGYHLSGDGHSIVDPDGHTVADHLQWDKHGQLNDASKQALTAKGLNVADQAFHYRTHTASSQKVHMSPHEFFKHGGHRGFIRDHRQLWYDNNTPGNYDLNELRMDWGANGAGIDEHGNYVFNVGGMTADGSFHGSLSTNAQHLAQEGKLAVALSMTKDSQHFVKLIHIDEHGNAIIDKDSIAGRSMFTTEGGHAKFIGAYAETVQVLSNSKEHGVSTRMLATVVGSNHAHHFTDVIHHNNSRAHEYFITHINGHGAGATEMPGTGDGLPVEIPPVIPVYPRRGLERLENSVGLTNPNVANSYYGGRSLAELQEWVRNNPSVVRTRREVTDKNGNKKWVEADGSEVKRDVKRERDTINTYLDKEKAQNRNHWDMVEKVANSMEPMENAARVAINVPAWMEARNLQNFLEEYTKQVDKSGNPLDPNLFEINILINRKTGTTPDNSTEVINKFIAEFQNKNGFKPKINYYDVELDPPFNNVGYARKLLTDAILLRSLRRDAQTNPLYIETEDADMVRIDKKTVANLVEKLDSNPHLDAVRGVQDRSPEYLKDNDMLFLRRRAWDFFEILARAKEFRDPRNPNWNYSLNRVITGGWNTGYTAEAYALIQGYDSLNMGEDMMIGEKISMARGDGTLPNLEVVGKVYSRSDSSPRRFIGEIITGNGAYSSDFTDEELNREIRNNSVPKLLRRISGYRRIKPENEAEFAGAISNYAHAAKQVTPNAHEATQLTKRLLFWLGFQSDDYEIDGDDIKIKNWNNVKEALERYRKRYDAKLAVSS
jgi:adenylate kinase family enzyme